MPFENSRGYTTLKVTCFLQKENEGFSLAGLPGESKRPSNPQRGLLGAFSIVLSLCPSKFIWVIIFEVKSVIPLNGTFPRET